MTVFLTLGDVIFQDFEVPEFLPFGGKQALVVHRLPGGARTIDAMGSDDSDRRWSGRFRGYAAESRAKRLDFLRNQGKPLLLTWSTFRYRVLIESYDPDFRQPFEIPYSISCVVLADESSPLLAAIGAVNTLKNASSGSIANIGATVGLAQTAVLGVTTQAEGTLAAAGVFTPGNNPTALASTLTSQATGFGQLNQLYQMGSTLGRMSKNLNGGN